MWRIGTGLLVAVVLASLASAAPERPDLVLGIEWRAGGGQLAWRSAKTLAPVGRIVNAGGAGVDLEALSPDGTLAALSRSDGQLRIVRLSPLRSVGTLGTGGKHVAAAIWMAADRLVAVAGGETPAVVVVDPRARRVLSRRQLDGELYGGVAAGKRLIALLAPDGAIGQARLAVVAGDGSVRTVPLPGVSAGFAPPADQAGTGRMASPGLAVNPEGTRAAVVGLETFLVVDLETLEIERAATRAPARVGKRIEGWSRGAVWLRGDRLAVIARTHSYEGDRPVWTTSGVRLHLLGAPPIRTLDETATGATRVEDTLLAYGGTALRGYRLDGTLRFEVLPGRDTGYVQTAGRYAYVGSDNSTRFSVVDVRTGRVIGTALTAKPTVVVGP
jgi:hypothetical protein